MIIFPADQIQVNTSKLDEIKNTIESTLRLIVYSRKVLADDLLNAYMSKTTNYRDLLSIRNAQLEAQTEQEAKEFTALLNDAVKYIIGECEDSVNFKTQVQLFQLFRIISPNAHARHPNRYRDKIVQIGRYICPTPNEIPHLVQQLFQEMERIPNPVIKAIYFHHECIRIHPFVDGNGRTARMAKNWMLMYELYTPIFISGIDEKREYIQTLENSFSTLIEQPLEWNEYLADFFNQEMNRLHTNTLEIYNHVKNTEAIRQTSMSP